MPKLFAVLPVFNEGADLTDLVRLFGQAVVSYPFQVIVVDDGSTDDSMTLLEAAQIPGTDIIRHPRNKGLGEAIRTGFLLALERAEDQDMIVVMDSDGTHSPFLVERMAGLIREGNDVVIASRYRYGSQVIGLKRVRLFLSHAASWVFRFKIPVKNVKDYTCGFRVYRAVTLKKAFRHYGEQFITESGFACMAEILIKLGKLGALFCEVPMILRYDRKMSTSKLKIARTILQSLNLVRRHA